jgi:large subunit ribosomal protein L9
MGKIFHGILSNIRLLKMLPVSTHTVYAYEYQFILNSRFSNESIWGILRVSLFRFTKGAPMKMLRVFLIQDVEKVGMAGEIIKAAEGYARNYLIPRKLGQEVTHKNEASFANRIKTIEKRHEIVESKTSMLAEKIKSIQVVLKRKTHDNDQLYGSISPREIAEELSAQHGITVSNSQVIIEKAIKAKGLHTIIIKLSSKLQPTLKIKIIPEVTA